jgi:hypothetical protein
MGAEGGRARGVGGDKDRKGSRQFRPGAAKEKVMKKRTLIGNLQEELAEEIKARDLKIVAAGKITIAGSGKHVSAFDGDRAC